jgi:hypothetical protein
VERERLREQRGHAHLGIEGGVQVLEDHLHLGALPAQRGLAEAADLLAAIAHRARGGRLKTQDRATQRGLAAPALPDDAEGLPLRHGQAHAVHRRHVVVRADHAERTAAVEEGLEVADFEER